MTTPKARLILMGLAFGVLLALLLAPQTRWLVRLQLAPSLSSDALSRQRFVQSHPNDYLVQLGGQTTASADHSRSLVSRFPESPSLRANILRYETPVIVHLSSRADSSGNLLSGTPNPPPDPHRDNPPPTLAQLAAFDADAAAGERLDPDNAYFPFMRSVGLFSARRDAEGLAAVTRAGTKTVWREYYEDDVEGRWRILDGVHGHREAVGSMTISANLLFPHYQGLRAVARLVTVQAVKEEMAGHREQGLARRRSAARCGDLMRAQGASFIANIVGISITMISWQRPGGAAPIAVIPGTPTAPNTEEHLEQKRLDAYCDYVTRLGYPDAAREAQAQSAAGKQVRHLPMSKFLLGSRLQDFWRLALSLVAGWLVVSLLILFLLLGLAAKGLSRLPRLRGRRPLPAGASVGSWAILLLAFAVLFFVLPARPEEVAGYGFILAILFLIPLAAFSIYAVFQPTFRRPFGQAVLAGLVTLTVLGIFAGLAAWRYHGITDYLTTVQDIQGLSGAGYDGTWSDAAFLRGVLAAFVGLLFLATLPLLLTVIFGIASRVRRIPASAGLVEGFRAWTPLALCVLAVFYGGLTLWTVRQEDAVNYGLERSLQGEGQYLALLTGKPWPEPVRH